MEKRKKKKKNLSLTDLRESVPVLVPVPLCVTQRELDCLSLTDCEMRELRFESLDREAEAE